MNSHQSQIPQRPGSKTLFTIGILGEFILFVIRFSWHGQNGKLNSFILWSLTFALFALPLAIVALWIHLERIGWYADYSDLPLPSLPHTALPHTAKSSTGGIIVIFYQDKIVCAHKIVFGGEKILHYTDIRRVNVYAIRRNSSLHYSLVLAKIDQNFHKVGEEPLSLNLSAFSQKEWVVILRLLELCAPQAEFDALAQHLKSGKVPRF